MPTTGQVVPLTPQERDDDPQILVVDDSPANLVAFEVALSDLGGRVVQASSGEEALRILTPILIKPCPLEELEKTFRR